MLLRKERNHAVENLVGVRCCGSFARCSERDIGGVLGLWLQALVSGTSHRLRLLDTVLVSV